MKQNRSGEVGRRLERERERESIDFRIPFSLLCFLQREARGSVTFKIVPSYRSAPPPCEVRQHPSRFIHTYARPSDLYPFLKHIRSLSSSSAASVDWTAAGFKRHFFFLPSFFLLHGGALPYFHQSLSISASVGHSSKWATVNGSRYFQRSSLSRCEYSKLKNETKNENHIHVIFEYMIVNRVP